MPARYRGDARVLSEMLTQGLPEIASYLRCGPLDGPRCREYIKQAFPNATGVSVNAAYRWVQNAWQASKLTRPGGKPIPESEIPKGIQMTPGNNYQYDTVTTWVNPDDGSHHTFRLKINSPNRLSPDDILGLIQDNFSPDSPNYYNKGGPTTSSIPDDATVTVLTFAAR